MPPYVMTWIEGVKQFQLDAMTWNDLPAYLGRHGLEVQRVQERGELEFVAWCEVVADSVGQTQDSSSLYSSI